MKTGILLLAIFRGLMFVAALIGAIIYATRKFREEQHKKKTDTVSLHQPKIADRHDLRSSALRRDRST